MYQSKGALLRGRGDDGGRRAETENIPYMFVLGCKQELLTSDTKWRDNVDCMERTRSRLLNRLTVSLYDLGTNIVCPKGLSDSTQKLPNTLSVILKGVRSGKILSDIGLSVGASTASSCHEVGGALLQIFEHNGGTYILFNQDIKAHRQSTHNRLISGPQSSSHCRRIKEETHDCELISNMIM